MRYWLQKQGQCEGEVPGYFASFITLGSMLLVLVSLPLSLFFVVKVVQVSIIKSSMMFIQQYTVNIDKLTGDGEYSSHYTWLSAQSPSAST